jgi:O-succinylbenzoic acid--CoA ligase
MSNYFLHKDFRWNGTSFKTKESLFQFVDDHFPELITFIEEWLGDRGLIHCMTSGSTGAPKMIGLERNYMVNSAKATGAYFNLGVGTSALLCLPLGFIAGRMMLVRSMVLGWHLDCIEPNSAPEIPEKSSYDFSAMVPFQLHHCVANLSQIKTLIVGGGEVSKSLRDRIQNFQTKIYATYGMTETVSHVALMPLNKNAGYNDLNNNFTGLEGVRFSVDQRQCLCINAPDITAQEIVTNDIVELISDKRFNWIARYDNVINSGGIKLIPEVIENKFRALIDGNFFVHSIPDKVLGDKLVIIVETTAAVLSLGNLVEYQEVNASEISKYEVPKKIYFLKSFIKTETGKVNRKLTMHQIDFPDKY